MKQKKKKFFEKLKIRKKLLNKFMGYQIKRELDKSIIYSIFLDFFFLSFFLSKSSPSGASLFLLFLEILPPKIPDGLGGNSSPFGGVYGAPVCLDNWYFLFSSS